MKIPHDVSPTSLGTTKRGGNNTGKDETRRQVYRSGGPDANQDPLTTKRPGDEIETYVGKLRVHNK